MMRQFPHRVAAAAAAVVLAFLVAPLGAQNGAPDPTSTKKSWTPKRLPDGQPDMQGTYVSGWFVPQERFTDAERKAWQERMVKYRGADPGAYGSEWFETALHKNPYQPPPGTVLVVDPPDGKAPLQPWALAKRNYISDHWMDKPEYVDSRVRCLPAGPRFGFSSSYNGWQVIQTPGHVIILQEHNHNFRVIPIDSKAPPLSKTIQLWEGDSRGRWEGNTLVVEVTNFTDKTWVIGEIAGEGLSVGTFHSPSLKMTERFIMRDADNIDYEAIIEDPNVYTRPWKIRYGIWERAPKGYENYEFACHEGNRWNELVPGAPDDNEAPNQK
jgi:hypothetical protein